MEKTRTQKFKNSLKHAFFGVFCLSVLGICGISSGFASESAPAPCHGANQPSQAHHACCSVSDLPQQIQTQQKENQNVIFLPFCSPPVYSYSVSFSFLDTKSQQEGVDTNIQKTDMLGWQNIQMRN